MIKQEMNDLMFHIFEEVTRIRNAGQSEYARNFLTKLDRKYIQKDLLTIAKQQYSLEKKEVIKNNFMILDTDLLTIKLWSYYKFNSVDKWIVNKIDEQKKENRISF